MPTTEPVFTVEDHFLPGARQGRVTLPNGWRLSAVTGPDGCGLHGSISRQTFEVAVFNPLGRMIGDVRNHQTAEQLRRLILDLSDL